MRAASMPRTVFAARGRSMALLGVLLLLGAGCGKRTRVDREPAGPNRIALELFSAARLDEPTDEILHSVFGSAGIEEHRDALIEALALLPRDAEPEVVRTERPDGTGMAFVDLVARSPGGGSASYGVHLRENPPGRWRVVWFHGPECEWPPRPPEGGASLTTSAHPETRPPR